MKTPAATAQRLTSPRHYRALRELLKGPQTVRQLLFTAGGNGIPQLIASLRSKGLVIATVDRKGRDRDQRPVMYCQYILHRDSHKLAEQLIQEYLTGTTG